MLALILPVTGFLVTGSIPKQFFPPAERDQFQIELELSSSASLKQTKSVVETATARIRFYDPNLDTLRELGSQAPSQLVQVPNVTHTRTSLEGVLPKLALDLDEEPAQLTGLDHTWIAQSSERLMYK